MANQKHLDRLMVGHLGKRQISWNTWRRRYPFIEPDLSGAQLGGVNLSGFDLNNVNFEGAFLDQSEFLETNLRTANFKDARLQQANLSGAYLSWANLTEADFREATLFGAYLRGANLSGANFTRADLSRANFSWIDIRSSRWSNSVVDKNPHTHRGADLSKTILVYTNLSGADLSLANLSGADLTGANLCWTNLSGADLSGAVLADCYVFATSAWNVKLENAKQSNLKINNPEQLTDPEITVDTIEVAQLIYLLLDNQHVRKVIEAFTSKVVLILGSFAPERKGILETLRNELRKRNYSPVLFDFEKPTHRDFTETATTLAHLSRFILADLTDPGSIPQELQAIVPALEVPVVPLLEETKRGYILFNDFRKYHWVLPIHFYRNQAHLVTKLDTEIIMSAEKKFHEIRK
jgi:uncharacterized protein YjbI with pentapeptide repeats